MKKLITLVVFLVMINLATAFTGGSANYNITISNVNYGTGDASSENFNMTFSLVEQPVAQVASSNFIIGLGFYHSIVEEVEELFSACYYHPDIYLYALGLSIILFVISCFFNDNILRTISGMLLIIAAVAIMIEGICTYNDWLTRSVAFILLGLGLYQFLSIWWHLKNMEEEF